MDSEDFISRYPTVFHLASAANWPSIQDHGLLSSKNLCGRVLKLTASETKEITSSHRPYALLKDGVIFRDQKPMNEAKLIRCLQQTMTPAEWYQILNERVFFWTTHVRLTRFLAVYKGEPGKILAVDTAELLRRHGSNVEVCHLNSGATRMPNHYRNRSSFCKIEDFAYSSKHKPAEVTVIGEVPDIVDFSSIQDV